MWLSRIISNTECLHHCLLAGNWSNIMQWRMKIKYLQIAQQLFVPCRVHVTQTFMSSLWFMSFIFRMMLVKLQNYTIDNIKLFASVLVHEHHSFRSLNFAIFSSDFSSTWIRRNWQCITEAFWIAMNGMWSSKMK